MLLFVVTTSSFAVVVVVCGNYITSCNVLVCMYLFFFVFLHAIYLRFNWDPFMIRSIRYDLVAIRFLIYLIPIPRRRLLRGRIFPMLDQGIFLRMQPCRLFLVRRHYCLPLGTCIRQQSFRIHP